MWLDLHGLIQIGQVVFVNKIKLWKIYGTLMLMTDTKWLQYLTSVLLMIWTKNGLVWFGWLVGWLVFNNILWRSVLLVEETGGPWENHQSLTNYHIMLYTSPWSKFELTTSEVIGTDCIGSCKSNYHTITAPSLQKFETWLNSFTNSNCRIINSIVKQVLNLC